MVILSKKFNKYAFSYLLSLVCVFCFAIINSNLSFAISSKGLTLSPLRSELDIAPGTSVGGSLMVKNSTNSDIEVLFGAEEFSVTNQQYDYKFIPESDLSKWVSYKSNNINLTAGQSSTVKYQISVPLSAEPGGRYISLFASTDTKGTEDSINSRQRVASLLYINVTGDVSRTGELLSLNHPWFVATQGQWSMMIQNKGTTHFRSRYNVKLKSVFSNDILLEESGDALILPGSVRLTPDDVLIPKIPGFYKVIITVGLGDTPSKNVTRLMVFMPPYVIISLVIILTLIISRKRFKKH